MIYGDLCLLTDLIRTSCKLPYNTLDVYREVRPWFSQFDQGEVIRLIQMSLLSLKLALDLSKLESSPAKEEVSGNCVFAKSFEKKVLSCFVPFARVIDSSLPPASRLEEDSSSEE